MRSGSEIVASAFGASEGDPDATIAAGIAYMERERGQLGSNVC
jgi:hypothetical protein